MIRGNALLVAFVVLYLASMLLEAALSGLNIRHLRRRGHEAPPAFAGHLDGETLARMSRYGAETGRFQLFKRIWSDAVTLALVLSGLLPWLDRFIRNLEIPSVLSGLVFFGALGFAGGILDLPFRIWGTFVIERRWGFSTISWRTWLADLAKEALLAALLMGLLLGSLLAIVQHAPRAWWFWTWLLFVLFEMLLLWLYPVWIAPLFNRFEPLRDEELRRAVLETASRAGIAVEGVYQVDAGRRSRHTNAYFTGLGRTKRIVLYDTLLASHERDEILAVLAHEIGHWKLRHVAKKLAALLLLSLAVLLAASFALEQPALYGPFGFSRPSAYVGLFLLSVLLQPLQIVFLPLGAIVSRRFEREADGFAFALTGKAVPLAAALRRLARDNLANLHANLHPHPLYTFFHYSHPPLAERIAALEAMERRPAP